MPNNYSVEIRGLESLDDFDEIPRQSLRSAVRAVNFATRFARTQSGRDLREQIAFPARYLVGESGRIKAQFANRTSLQGRLSASSTPRSLARFVQGNPRGRGKVKVQVQPGGLRAMPGAFLLKIRGQGGAQNSLLAVRSPTAPRGAYRPRRLGDGLWSLYGPSVAQALLSEAGTGIWPALEAEIVTKLEQEYLRQMELDA